MFGCLACDVSPYLTDIFSSHETLLKPKACFTSSKFRDLSSAIANVHESQGFFITAWVFLPDPWHAIVYPHPLTISNVLRTIKLRSTSAINERRSESGPVWQERFFDRILRTVKEYWETVDYIHMNPVRRGLMMRSEDWRWSSIHSLRRRPAMPLCQSMW